MTALRTFAGLQFKVRREGEEDDLLAAEFWRHVSRTNLPAGYVGILDQLSRTPSQRPLDKARKLRTLSF